MEASVKWLQFSNLDERGRLINSRVSGKKPALCLRGRKFASCIIDDETTLRIEKVELKDYDSMDVLLDKGKPYDPRKCARNFIERYSRSEVKRTATQGALELLYRVLNGEVPDEAIEAPAPPPAPKSRSTILAVICAELKINPTAARRRLRKAGLHAPYENESEIRGVLK